MDRTGTMLILLATVLLMVVAACTQRETYDRTLMRAERMTDTNPYGALTLLNGRKDSLCAGPADSALYKLVYTEAVHDLGVTLANSAYIDRSADYFRQCGDRRRRARALVQTALCRYDNRDWRGAMLLAKTAEEVAAGTDDDFHRNPTGGGSGPDEHADGASRSGDEIPAHGTRRGATHRKP